MATNNKETLLNNRNVNIRYNYQRIKIFFEKIKIKKKKDITAILVFCFLLKLFYFLISNIPNILSKFRALIFNGTHYFLILT